MKKLYTFLILFTALTIHSSAQIITISEARGKALGTTVTVSGVATTGDELGVPRYMQDNTAGIVIYDNAASDVQRGDSIVVTGELTEFNGLLEIVNVTSLDRFPIGKTVTPQTLSLSAGFQEQYEGQLVQFTAVKFTSPGNFSTSSANYDITNGSVTKEVRVWSSTDIGGSPIPASKVNVTGVMGEYNGTHQLQPRAQTDISVGGPKFTTSLQQSNIQPFSFTVSWETEKPGNSIIRYGSSVTLGSEVVDVALDTLHSIDVTGLSHGSIYYVQGLSVDGNGDTSKSGVQLMATRSISPGNIHVYFNQEIDDHYRLDTRAQYVNNALADTIIAYINRAQNTIDVAIYNINNNDIINALNSANQRGVDVRLIADDGVNSFAYGDINIGVANKKKAPPSSQSYGIMHNKFVVIDAEATVPSDAYVITGSTNMTNGQLNEDPNNLIIVQDQALARAYTIEFNEMWGGKFGADKTDNTPHHFRIGGRDVELYFSPSDNVEEQIKNVIYSADEELYFALLVWTRFGLAYDIEDEIQNDGVFAAGIVEDTTTGPGGFPFRIVADDMNGRMQIDKGSDIFHHKYAIVDPQFADSDPLVLTGSHNWSTSANTRNDENTLIVYDQDIARQYMQEFHQRFQENGGGDLLEVTGIPLAAENGFHIYPNPATSNLTIQGEANYHVQVFNITGQLQAQFSAAGSHYVNVSDWNKGMYLLVIQQDDQRMVQKVIVE